MELMLTVTSSQRLSLGTTHQAVVDTDVFSIGRGQDNSWVLPDPKMHVSGKHCVIHKRNNEFHLTDISTNGVFVNGDTEPLGRGRSAVLRNGDALSIGEYEIKVKLEADNALPDEVEINNLINKQPIHPEAVNADQAITSVLSDTPSQPTDNSDPFADLLGNRQQQAYAETQSDHVPPEKTSFIPPKTHNPVEQVPADTPAPVNEAAPSGDGGFAIPDDWMNADAGQPQVQQTIDVPQPQLDNGTDFQLEDILPTPKEEVAQVVEPTPTPAPHLHVVPEEPVEVEQPVIEPQPQAVHPTTNTVEQSSAPDAVADDDMLALILAAADIPLSAVNNKSKREIAEMIGKLLGGYTQGMVETLATRNMVKSEFRLQQTMIRPVDNNPLKFSPTGTEALKIMMFADSRAYLSADDAIAEGYYDIQAHQLAMMSGIQAAFSSLMERFDPEKLEAKFAGKASHSKGFSFRNRVDNWLEYKDYYLDICKLMEDKFQDLFTTEFGRAYEEQLRKLKNEIHS
ncbi:MAG: type VI secretion system-associated FHA domain protein TagH [Chromatiales bacterium]|nr:type VI secretion system-associated FHA domain protein TagH [Chromatiales bacterium]